MRVPGIATERRSREEEHHHGDDARDLHRQRRIADQHERKDDVEVLPTTFDRQLLAFPLADGSPLRDRLDGALRRYMQQPGWRDLQDRYLASSRATVHLDQ